MVPHIQYALVPSQAFVKDVSFSLEPEMIDPDLVNRCSTLSPSQGREVLEARVEQSMSESVASTMGVDSKLAAIENISAAVEDSVLYASVACEKEYAPPKIDQIAARVGIMTEKSFCIIVSSPNGLRRVSTMVSCGLRRVYELTFLFVVSLLYILATVH